MLNHVIRFALDHRLVIICATLAVLVIGSAIGSSLSIDVLPDLTRPRVVLITEAEGMAPEEVEQLVTFPLETAINGASGVIAVRSSSDIGLSVINVEFDWGTDIYLARQIVQERMATALDRLPEGVKPQMGPISSLLGQIMLVGMWSESGATSPLDVRTLADWVVSQRLRTIEGVSQVITMGGGRKQYQVLVDLHQLHTFDVSLAEIERALRDSNLNVTGGYLQSESRELLVRGLGRLHSAEQLQKVVIKDDGNRPILLEQLAEVVPAAQVKRGDSSVNGHPAVVLTIQKQPGADTRSLTTEIETALDELRDSLPPDVQMQVTYRQREFIDYAVHNVVEALRDGAILVVIVLFLFLFNFRTTIITLTAIPISILVTAMVFRWFDLSINVMTLGGLAVALGELVDDAIVDVENIFRRLKQNAQLAEPRPIYRVVFDASVEVRNAIIVSTVIVIVVFAPIFALTGMAGRLFMPLGVAYIVSILASTVVSITLTPVLSYYLLPSAKSTTRRQDSVVLRALKAAATPLIRFSMNSLAFGTLLLVLIVGVVVCSMVAINMGKSFLPDFDEGAAQVNLMAQPGTSLETSTLISQRADARFREMLKSPDNPTGPLLWFTCRTGRAEEDEHVMGVNISEYVMSLNPDSGLSREELIDRLTDAVVEIPSVEHEVEQPIFHLISHMLSGVTAQIGIKLFGDDLDVLRAQANNIEHAIADVPGIREPVIEQQQIVPQLRIELDHRRLADYGITARFVHDFVETAMHGRVVSQLIEGQRYFDIVLRLNEQYRNDIKSLGRTPIDLPGGATIPLSAVARIYEGGGPSAIHREDSRRRIVVRVNTRDRALSDVVADIQAAISEKVVLPEGYFVILGGQFEEQRAASARIVLLSVVAVAVMFVVLYSTYPATGIVLQILIALPAAFIGGVLALLITRQTMSVAAMVGFISLGGIAARNGLLLISNYLHLIPKHGFTKDMILAGSLERLAPVLMTALTTGIGLVPLVIGGHLPGRELLYPVATVILGGLLTSTLSEFLLRPGLFWHFSARSGPRLASEAENNGAR